MVVCFFLIVLRFFFFAFVCLLFLPCHFCTVCTSVYDMPHVSPIFGLAIYFSNKVERETVDDLRCSPARQFVHPTHQTLPNMSQLPVLRNRIILESLKYISSSRFLFMFIMFSFLFLSILVYFVALLTVVFLMICFLCSYLKKWEMQRCIGENCCQAVTKRFDGKVGICKICLRESGRSRHACKGHSLLHADISISISV